MSGIAKLLNPNVLNKENEQVDLNDEKYQGKIFDLYSGACWCKPCYGFTQKLIEFYEKYFKEKKFRHNIHKLE